MEPELVEMAGGVNLFGDAAGTRHGMTWDELESKDPDIVFVSPCGVDSARTLQEMHCLSSKLRGRNEERRTGRVFVADGNQYFNAQGELRVDRVLAEIIHPNVFHFGHEGQAG